VKTEAEQTTTDTARLPSVPIYLMYLADD